MQKIGTDGYIVEPNRAHLNYALCKRKNNYRTGVLQAGADIRKNKSLTSPTGRTYSHITSTRKTYMYLIIISEEDSKTLVLSSPYSTIRV